MVPFLLPSEPVASLEQYLDTEVGGRGLERARRLGPAATIEELSASGLRGRGGAGFPTGRKWAGIAAQDAGRRFVVANAAEGEPGTFKDRALLRADPYQFVEGLIVAAETVGAGVAYVAIKASFERESARVRRALEEFQQAGMTGDLEVTVVAGPGEYLFGEEKAMLEVIEGNAPLPRRFPPYEHGLFATAPQQGWESAGTTPRGDDANPTLVNNVETLSNVPHLLARGAEWFRSMGTEASPGTIVATVSGDVIAPDVGEIELGTPLGAVIDAVGSGLPPGRSVQAVLSGVANAVIPGTLLDTPVTYEHLAAIGSGLGSAGFIVLDDTASMVDAAYRCSRFLSVESCGQCSPCKLGSSAITEALERIVTGTGGDADLNAIAGWLERVTDGARCYLATQEQQLVASFLRAFPEEFAARLEGRLPPVEDRRPFPLLVDLSDGVATYDERFWRKRPDWTYED